MTFTHALATNNYGEAKFIVTSSAANGTHTTIASALTAASSGDTIFVRAGTYTENLTLKVGVNLTAFECDAFTPNVTIVGTCTLTTAGTVTISGIRLQTNAAFAVAVTGSAASILNLVGCYLNCTNNTGISFTSSSASSMINLINCNGDVGANGIAIFACSGAGSIFFDRSYITNSGATTTNSTISSGNLFHQYSYIEVPFSTSATGVLTGSHTHFSTFATNQKMMTIAGDANALLRHCTIKTGTATAITVTSGLNLQQCNIESTNAVIIDGAGTLTYNPIQVSSTGDWAVTTTTQTLKEIGPSATVGSLNSGGTNILTVQNESNTASSTAAIQATVAGGTAADAVFRSNITAGQNWTWGLDNSDSDAYVLAASAALGTTNTMRVSTAGEVNFPLTPAVLATMGSGNNDVTGDGTVYTLGPGATAWTEVFDQGGDFVTTGTFTAPVTGRYFIQYNCGCNQLGAAHTALEMNTVTSNRTYVTFNANGANLRTANNNFRGGSSVLADMDAADTCTFNIQVSNSTLTVDIGSANTTFISICLDA